MQWGAGIWVTGDDVNLGPQLELRWNHSFGIKLSGSAQRVHMDQLNIWANDTAIEASSGDITGFQLTNSWIYNHSTMVVNTVGGDDDRGASALVLYHTTGSALVEGNTIWNNRAISNDYGVDGEAFNIYGSTGLVINNNRMYDNEAILETGTDGPANSVALTNNIIWKPDTSTAPVPGKIGGIIIRACQNCPITGNRIYDTTSGYTFTVSVSSFTGGVINSNVHFSGNQVEQSVGKAISIGSTSWTGINVHDNTYYLEGTGTVGYSPLNTGEVVITGPNPTRP